jgi:hypothetical protein
MNWTVMNVSPDTVTITDTPIPISWVPGQIRVVPVAYLAGSAQLSQAMVAMQLCITAYGAWMPLPPFAPVTYAVQGNWQETGLVPVTVTQDGNSPPLTLGPFTQGSLLMNVADLTSGSSVALSFAAWDGAVYYPAQAVGSTLTSAGPVAVAWDPPTLAGRFQWTVSGSVTWTVLYQVQP